MLGGLRAEEMQAEGCQREIKALQCTVHKLFSFSLLALCSGLQAAAADPLLPPRFPSDTLLVPIRGASNVCANHGRVRSRLAGGWGWSSLRPLQFLHPLMATVSYTLDNDDVRCRTNRGISLNGAPVDGR